MPLSYLPEPVSARIAAIIAWWYHFNPWLRGLILLTILVLAGVLVFGPGYQALKSLTARQHRAAALEALEAGDHAKARDLSKSLILSGRGGLEMARVYERATEALGDPAHLDAALFLMNLPGADATDRLRALAAASKHAPFGELMRFWLRMPPWERENLDIRATLAERMLRDRSYSAAWDMLVDVPEENPPPGIQLLRIRTQLGFQSLAACDLAQKWLVALWTDHPDHRAQAAELIQRVPLHRLDPAILAPLRPSLAAGIPEKPGMGELLELRLLWVEAEEDERDALLTRAVESWQQAAPENLAAFLKSLQAHELLTVVFDDDAVAGNGVLLRARLDSLLRIQQNEEASKSFRLHGGSLDVVMRPAYAAVIAQRLGEHADKAAHWKTALDEAGVSMNPRAVLELYEFAEIMGVRDLAQEALYTAVQKGRGPLPGFDALAPWLDSLAEAGDETKLMEIFLRYLKMEPENSRLISRYCHLAAFTRRETAESLMASVSDLLEHNPNRLHLRTVLACLQLLAGNPGESLESWRSLALPPEQLLPGMRAAWLVAAVKAGEVSAESAEVAAIPWNEMMPSERARLRELLSQE